MKYALVCEAVASLRKEPNHNSGLEDELLYGMKVRIQEETGDGWFKVRSHYRYEGYLPESSLFFGEEEIRAFEHGVSIVVYQAYADVLDQPRFQGLRLLGLTRGARLRYLAPTNQDGFVMVALCDGRKGYIKEKMVGECLDSIYQDVFYEKKAKQSLLTPLEYLQQYYGLSEEEFRNRVVTTALLYLGTQYRWGGKTPLGIDCSGLCSMAYLLNGMVIYRDASIQPDFPIHKISFEEKKPGDLVFFKGHVAMYIGEGKYVHSTGKNGSDGVVVNSFLKGDSDYREDLLSTITETGSIF